LNSPQGDSSIWCSLSTSTDDATNNSVLVISSSLSAALSNPAAIWRASAAVQTVIGAG